LGRWIHAVPSGKMMVEWQTPFMVQSMR